jgi:hypothetical protein
MDVFFHKNLTFKIKKYHQKLINHRQTRRKAKGGARPRTRAVLNYNQTVGVDRIYQTLEDIELKQKADKLRIRKLVKEAKEEAERNRVAALALAKEVADKEALKIEEARLVKEAKEEAERNRVAALALAKEVADKEALKIVEARLRKEADKATLKKKDDKLETERKKIEAAEAKKIGEQAKKEQAKKEQAKKEQAKKEQEKNKNKKKNVKKSELPERSDFDDMNIQDDYDPHENDGEVENGEDSEYIVPEDSDSSDSDPEDSDSDPEDSGTKKRKAKTDNIKRQKNIEENKTKKKEENAKLRVLAKQRELMLKVEPGDIAQKLDKLKTIKQIIQKDMDEILTDVTDENDRTLYSVLSQLFSGDQEMKDEIKKIMGDFIKPKSPNNILDEITAISKTPDILTACQAFKCDIMFLKFESNGKHYSVYPYIVKDNINFVYIRSIGKNFYGMIPKVQSRTNNLKTYEDENGDNQILKQGEFVINKILKHDFSVVRKNKGRKNLNIIHANFLVNWKNYSEANNSWEPWESVYRTNELKSYIEEWAKNKKDLFDEIMIEEARKIINIHADAPEEEEPPEDNRFGTGKKLTGRAYNIAEDELFLKGLGGCYCFMPFNNIDKNNNAAFKIGMTIDFINRIKQYHTYFPEGMYHIAFLVEPRLPDWKPEKTNQWKARNKFKKVDDEKKALKKARRTSHFKDVEKFLFNYIVANKGTRIHSTTKSQDVDILTQEGVTEWVFCNEDLIHDAFRAADKKFEGGVLYNFYLKGLDPFTNMNHSIDDDARIKKLQFPNFTAKLISRTQRTTRKSDLIGTK